MTRKRSASSSRKTSNNNSNNKKRKTIDTEASRKARSSLQLYTRGQRCYEEGRYADAIQCFEKAVEINSRDVFALSGLASAYEQVRRYTEAIPLLRKIIEIDPHSYFSLESHSDLARVKYLMGRFHESRDEYNAAIKSQYLYWVRLTSKREKDQFREIVIRTFRGKAAVCTELKDHETELKCFLQVAKLERSAMSYNDIALTYLILGKHEDALQNALKAISIDDSFIEAYLSVAIIRDELGKDNPDEYDLAIEACETALRSNPDVDQRSRALHILGYLYGQKKDFDTAENYLIDSFNLMRTVKAANQLAYTLCKKEQLIKAHEYADIALRMALETEDQDTYLVYDTLAKIYEKEGDYDAAIDYSQHAKKLNPEFSNVADKRIRKCERLKELSLNYDHFATKRSINGNSSQQTLTSDDTPLVIDIEANEITNVYHHPKPLPALSGESVLMCKDADEEEIDTSNLDLNA